VTVVRDDTATNASAFLFLYNVGRSLLNENEILKDLVIATSNTLRYLHQLTAQHTKTLDLIFKYLPSEVLVTTVSAGGGGPRPL
jgi:hypothetical protein